MWCLVCKGLRQFIPMRTWYEFLQRLQGFFMLNVILRNLKYLLNTILRRSLGILKVYWHQNFAVYKSMYCGGATPHTCTKGISLHSGPCFARTAGRVAGWQVSLVYSSDFKPIFALDTVRSCSVNMGMCIFVFAQQKNPGSCILIPVQLRPINSPHKTQHEAHLPLCWIFNKLSVWSQIEWCFEFKNHTAKTCDTGKWSITLILISFIFLLYSWVIFSCTERRQLHDSFSDLRSMNEWIVTHWNLCSYNLCLVKLIIQYNDSCMFLGFYGSIISGLQARMHTGTVVINNKTLIFL